MRRRKRRKLQPWQKRRRKAVALVTLIAVVIGPVLVWRSLLAKNVEARLQALRDTGFPTTAEELDVWQYKNPEEGNAANVYIEAYGAYVMMTSPSASDALPFFGWKNLDPLGPLPDETMEAMPTFLASNSKALEKLHEAAGIEECWYPRDFSDPWTSGTWEYLRRMATQNKLLCLEAVAAVEQQDPARVEEALLTALALAGSARNEPVIWAHWTRSGCLRGFLTALLRALAQLEFEDPALERLATALAAHEYPKSARNALIGERCIMLTQIAHVYFRQDRNVIERLMVSIGIADKLTMLHLDALAEVLAAAELPRHEGLAVLDGVQAELETRWLFRRFPYVFVPSFLAGIAENEAVVRIGRTLLAIERYRLAEERLPEELANLVPRFLGNEQAYRDPFDGQALRYEPSENGYRVYSVGQNRIDDNGNRKSDITFQSGR